MQAAYHQWALLVVNYAAKQTLNEMLPNQLVVLHHNEIVKSRLHSSTRAKEAGICKDVLLLERPNSTVQKPELCTHVPTSIKLEWQFNLEGQQRARNLLAGIVGRIIICQSK